MKLYEVPNNSRISIDNGVVELNFHHVDGLYSYCTTDDGQVVHLKVTAEVEVINED
jgi:hypothetical protein